MYRLRTAAKLEDPVVTQRAVVLILPNFFYENEKVLRSLIHDKFSVIEKRWVRLSRDDVIAWRSLDNLEGGWDWAERVSDGPSMVALVQREEVFSLLEPIVNYFNLEAAKTTNHTGIYSSHDMSTAVRDISYFFPSTQCENSVLHNAETYLATKVFPRLNEGLAALAVARPDEPVKWLADFLKK